MIVSRANGYGGNWVPDDKVERKKLREQIRYRLQPQANHFPVRAEGNSDPFQLWSKIELEAVSAEVSFIEQYLDFLRGVEQGLVEEKDDRCTATARQISEVVAEDYDINPEDLAETLSRALKTTGIHERLEQTK